MTSMDFESDQFLKLLTDALRAGPGSPQWHDAILRLQAGEQNGNGTSEYRLLCEARAHLESGREYRSIRAGPGFTRTLMNAVEAEGVPGKRTFSTATLIALLAAIAVLGTVATVVWILVANGSKGDLQSAAIDALASRLLGNPIASASLDQPPPADWKVLGKLPLDFSRGMHARVGSGSTQLQAGGLVWQTPIPADTAFEVEAAVKFNRSNEKLLPEVVISDSADVGDEHANGAHELVWLIQSDEAKVVLPSGQVQAQGDLHKEVHDPLIVRIRADQTTAIVTVNGKQMWAGSLGLAADKPRYVAIRLLARDFNKQDVVSFQSVRILTGQ